MPTKLHLTAFRLRAGIARRPQCLTLSRVPGFPVFSVLVMMSVSVLAFSFVDHPVHPYGQVLRYACEAESAEFLIIDDGSTEKGGARLCVRASAFSPTVLPTPHA